MPVGAERMVIKGSAVVTIRTGSTGFRGGAWNNHSPALRVSNRAAAASPLASRSLDLGFRAVRSAL